MLPQKRLVIEFVRDALYMQGSVVGVGEGLGLELGVGLGVCCGGDKFPLLYREVEESWETGGDSSRRTGRNAGGELLVSGRERGHQMK